MKDNDKHIIFERVLAKITLSFVFKDVKMQEIFLTYFWMHQKWNEGIIFYAGVKTWYSLKKNILHVQSFVFSLITVEQTSASR